MLNAAGAILLMIAWAPALCALQRAEQAPSTQDAPSCNSPSFRENFQHGEELLHQQRADTAIPYLEKARQLCPSDYVAGRELVIAYGKTGLTQKARAVADEIFREHEVAELHSLLGELYADRGDPRSAAEQYQRAAQLNPSEDNVFDFGASLLKFEGDSALRVFRFGVQQYPNSEKIHLGLGSALYGQGLTDEAVAEAFRASDLKPDDPKPMEVLGEMAHIPAALAAPIVERFSSLHTRYPRNARLAYYYAMALSGRWSGVPAAAPARVMDLLKTATELDPSFAEAQFQLGEFYQEQDRPLDALHSYERAAKLDPEQESYHYRLALAYKKCGYAAKYREEMTIYQKLHSSAK